MDLPSIRPSPSPSGSLGSFDHIVVERRHRSANFTEDQVRVLLKFVEKYKSIVCGLKTQLSHPSTVRKREAWAMVAAAVSAVGHPRTVLQVKKKWNDLRITVVRYIRNKNSNIVEKTYPARAPQYLEEIVSLMGDDLDLSDDNEPDAADENGMDSKDSFYDDALCSDITESQESQQGKPYLFNQSPLRITNIHSETSDPQASENSLQISNVHSEAGVTSTGSVLTSMQSDTLVGDVQYEPSDSMVSAAASSDGRAVSTPMAIRPKPGTSTLKPKAAKGVGKPGVGNSSEETSALWDTYLNEEIKKSRLQQRGLKRDLEMKDLLKQQMELDIRLKKLKAQYYLDKMKSFYK